MGWPSAPTARISQTPNSPNSPPRWTLEPIDTTVVSDVERERWGVAPLAQQRATAAKMNAD
jgi:hypothetical protein